LTSKLARLDCEFALLMAEIEERVFEYKLFNHSNKI
jgi:hypothetical protein